MSDPFDDLRRDVSYLGRILGDTLVEQEGPALLDLEERIRAIAKERRAGRRRHDAGERMRQIVRGLDTPTAERVARAFTHYFQLVNLAEQHHRRRRRRAYLRAGEAQVGSLASVFESLARNVPIESLTEVLARAQIDLVFTAHPTEAQRRTVLDKHRRVSALLARRDRNDLTPDEREGVDRALREEIATLWQTDEIRQERPRVGDEIKNTLFYVEEILFPLIPGFYREVERAAAQAYGREITVPPFLRFGSWVGADMDGNPNVTPELSVDTALAHGTRVLGLYLHEVGALGEALSQSTRRVGVSDELLASLTRDAEAMPALGDAVAPRTRNEPYRRKLRWVEARLNATREALLAARADGPTLTPHVHFGAGAYRAPGELLADLRLIEASLHAHRGERAGISRVRSLARMVEVFGFHLARLDVRVPAEWVREGVRRALWLADGAKLDAGVLGNALADARVPPRPDVPGMRAMEGLAAMRRAVSPGSGESFILSMAHGREDMLATLVLARVAGLYRPADGVADLSVVPLFETLDDLSRCASEVAQVVRDPSYARYLTLRGGVQEVMIGYSDSNKDAGILSASFALYRAQRALAQVGRENGIAVKVFHGRGGSIGRGGGPSQRAIEGLPPGSLDGRFKLTEQGEVIAWKYLLPEIAERNLELTAGGVLHATLQQRYPDNEELARYESVFEDVSRWSLEAYRGLVHDPEFVTYYESSTPLAEISAMPIGSRPSRRNAAARLEDLRAIPWVFAWTQSRQMVPGWFGAGRALGKLIATHGLDTARAMRARWPFFATTLDAVVVSLATADMDIARQYASLCEDTSLAWRMFSRVALDHGRAVRAVRAILGQDDLLSQQPTLSRTLALRNPYVDPLSYIQVELLRRKRTLLRAGQPVPAELERAILLTVNGIAAGLRNTG